MNDPTPDTGPSDPPGTPPSKLPTKTITSESILEGQPEVLITHGEETYRLRCTRNGKLILQK